MRLLLAGLVLSTITPSAGARQAPDPPRVRFLTSARQMGPVGYRDPIGAVSPDGRWLAFTSGGRLEVVASEGGPRRQLGELVQRIYSLTWLPDSRHIAVLERRAEAGPLGWSRYDLESGGRRPLWENAEAVPGILRGGPVPRAVTVNLSELRDLAWSPDGSQIAGILPRAEGSELWVLTATASSAAGETSPLRLSFPAWTPDGVTVGCLARDEGAPRITLPCGGRG